jgi:HK97 gp10 family phage protein
LAETTIEIIGLPQFIQFFNSRGPAMLKQGISNGLSDIADGIKNTTSSLCPVDTGALQASIDVTTTGDMITATVGEDYASYVDEGTSRMSAQPFFTKPIEGIANALNTVIEGTLAGTGIFNE